MSFEWTDRSEAFVRDNWDTMSTHAIVEALGASYTRVAAKAKELGLPGRTYSTEKLLELAREFKLRAGHYPRAGGSVTNGWQADDQVLCAELKLLRNQSTYQRRFGSLPQAWVAAEGKPYAHAAVRNRHFSDAELLAFLNLYKHVAGHYPRCTTNESGAERWVHQTLAEALSMPLPSRYRAKFGGVLKAAAAAAQQGFPAELLASLTSTLSTHGQSLVDEASRAQLYATKQQRKMLEWQAAALDLSRELTPEQVAAELKVVNKNSVLKFLRASGVEYASKRHGRGLSEEELYRRLLAFKDSEGRWPRGLTSSWHPEDKAAAQLHRLPSLGHVLKALGPLRQVRKDAEAWQAKQKLAAPVVDFYKLRRREVA